MGQINVFCMEQKLKRLPTISVAIATFNSGKTIDRCLRLVREQNYPQGKIEIILGDGGSLDETFKIAKKYKAKFIAIPPEKQHAEYNRGVAYNKATGELVLILDHDNFLPYKNWLKDMVDPLLENPDMVATNTCYYHYDKSYNLMDRYFALFGTSEPLPYYLHKADRMPQTAKKWVLTGQAKDMGNYYLVKFEKDPRKFPSIGTNGCLMRRKVVNKYADVRAEYHYPIDVLFDVIQNGGPDEFGFVKNSIIHLTHSRGFPEFLKRRKRFVEQYHFADRQKRRWSVVMPGDEVGVILFVFYSLTFIRPFIDALIGFIAIADIAWFVHPIMCFGTTIMYGYSTIKYTIQKWMS